MTTLVIVAEPEGPAVAAYRRVGLADAERQTHLFRAPDAWPDAG